MVLVQGRGELGQPKIAFSQSHGPIQVLRGDGDEADESGVLANCGKDIRSLFQSACVLS